MSTNSYPLLFSSTMLTVSDATVYEVPDTPITLTLQDLTLKLTNVTAATATASIYAVDAGGSASPANAAALDISVPAKDFILIPAPRLAAGSTISASASSDNAISIQAVTGKLHTL
tara:strand:- start:8 stop:355 length:348 start_codon:yes stop_codon:yes gene_type:complete